MKKLKEEVYAMGTMEVIDIRWTNKKVQEYCVCLGGGGSGLNLFYLTNYVLSVKLIIITLYYQKCIRRKRGSTSMSNVSFRITIIMRNTVYNN